MARLGDFGCCSCDSDPQGGGNPGTVVAKSKLLRERLEYPFEGLPFLRLVELQRQERCQEDCDEKSETCVSCQEGSCCPSSFDSR